MFYPLPGKHLNRPALERKWQNLWSRILPPQSPAAVECSAGGHVAASIRSDILYRYRLMRKAGMPPYPDSSFGKTTPSPHPPDNDSGFHWGILERPSQILHKDGVLEHILEEYGADALRFSLAGHPGNAPSPSRLKGSASLMRKIWNAFRYASSHLRGDEPGNPDPDDATDVDRWFLNRLNNLTAKVNDLFDREILSGVSACIEKLIRHDFCGWYLEFIRKEMDRPGTRRCLLYSILHLSHLLHPLMPHISEEIHSRLSSLNRSSLLELPYPEFRSELVFFRSSQDVEALRTLIRATRSIRRSAPPDFLRGSLIILQGSGNPGEQWLKSNQNYFLDLTGADSLSIQGFPPAAGFLGEAGGWRIWIPVEDADVCRRLVGTLRADGEKLRLRIHRMQRKLNDRHFMETVPSETASRWKRRLQQYLHSHEQILRRLVSLGKSSCMAPPPGKGSQK